MTLRVALLPALVAALAVLFLGCGGETWTRTIYPDGEDLTRSTAIGEFGEFVSLEECRIACQAALEGGASRRGDYECGRKHESRDALVCEATES